MTAFEVVTYCVLIIGYGAMCYMAGKGDLLNLIPQMLLEKAKEIEDRLNEVNEDG